MVFCSDAYLRWLWFRKIVKTVVSDPEGDAPHKLDGMSSYLISSLCQLHFWHPQT
jgi:hypothetical protein